MNARGKMPQINDLSNSPAKQWFAVYTYFRREKSACRELSKAGIECFIPLAHKTKKYGRKIKHYQVPLINHYIFVKISDTSSSTVLSCRDVIKFIRFSGELAPVPEREIDLLKRICGESNVSAIRFSRPDTPGQEVEIVSGNLAGTTARLIQFKNNDQVVIDLQYIGCSLYLELSVAQLRLIETSVID